MNYEQMANIGACGPVGCGPYGYAGAYGYPAPVAAPFFGGGVVQTDIVGRQAPYADPRVQGSLVNWDIVGQTPAPAPAPQESFLQRPGPLGVKNMYWLLGAAAIGATWFAYSRGYLGGMGGGGRYADGDFGGDFFF